MGNFTSVLVGLALITIGIFASISADKNYSTEHGGFIDFFTSVFWSNITDSYNSAVLVAIVTITIGTILLLLGLVGFMSTAIALVLGLFTALFAAIFLIISASNAKGDPNAVNSITYSIWGAVISIALILIILVTMYFYYIRSDKMKTAAVAGAAADGNGNVGGGGRQLTEEDQILLNKILLER